MRTAPHKTVLNNFVATKCFLKMSESEHSDSEFYYPGELSDAEMCNYLLTTEQQKESHYSWIKKLRNFLRANNRQTPWKNNYGVCLKSLSSGYLYFAYQLNCVKTLALWKCAQNEAMLPRACPRSTKKIKMKKKLSYDKMRSGWTGN